MPRHCALPTSQLGGIESHYNHLSRSRQTDRPPRKARQEALFYKTKTLLLLYAFRGVVRSLIVPLTVCQLKTKADEETPLLFLLKLLEVLPTLPLCTFLLEMHPALGVATSISSDSKLNGIKASNGKDDFSHPVGAMRRLNRVRGAGTTPGRSVTRQLGEAYDEAPSDDWSNIVSGTDQRPTLTGHRLSGHGFYDDNEGRCE